MNEAKRPMMAAILSPSPTASRLGEIAAGCGIDYEICGTADELEAALAGGGFDFAIINPTNCGGEALAERIASRGALGVLLLLGAQEYERSLDRLCQAGVFVLPRPLSARTFSQALSFMKAQRVRMLRFEEGAEKLQTKVDDLRIVSRAKLLLVSRLRMSEAEAHRYIEKQAMDACVKKREVAENIIRTYEQ